jgi:transcriptional regulator with XRE-family HTH domain
MADAIDIHLGRRLKRRRKLLGLSQNALALACGTTFQQIQKYECAANRMSAARLWQLSEALQTPVSYFYGGFCQSEPQPLAA